jgi:hypothetical protein
MTTVKNETKITCKQMPQTTVYRNEERVAVPFAILEEMITSQVDYSSSCPHSLATLLESWFGHSQTVLEEEIVPPQSKKRKVEPSLELD